MVFFTRSQSVQVFVVLLKIQLSRGEDHIGGVMVSVLDSSAVDCRFRAPIWLNQRL